MPNPSNGVNTNFFIWVVTWKYFELRIGPSINNESIASGMNQSIPLNFHPQGIIIQLFLHA